MMLERSIRLTNGEGHSRNKGGGPMDHEERSNPSLNEEEYAWAENMRRNGERLFNRNDNGRGESHFQLPRMDFPKFEGGDPMKWKINCEFYFDMYSIPGIYKTRMAVLNFSEDVFEWYLSLIPDGHQLPWEILVDEVLARYKTHDIKHPVDEFKRVHQTGKVEEYIRKFDKARARLLRVKPTLDEEFFCAGFISGLREEIKNTVDLLNPRGLNNVFQCALKVENSQEGLSKKPREAIKTTKFLRYPMVKTRTEEERKENRGGQIQTGQGQKQWQNWQPRNINQNMTFQQRRALGLCDKCNEKYYPGHQCAGKMMGLMTEPIIDEVEEDEELEEVEIEVVEELEKVEQAVISMYASTDKKKISSMKFKGQIGNVPICALLDSGSTHTFVNPEVIQSLRLPVNQANPMVVMVANGEKMVTDTTCQSLKFKLQGHEFERDVRLLAIQGYDMILGLDWLTSLGPMKIDWGQGSLEFCTEGKDVKLKVREETAEVKVIDGNLDIEKEVKKGSEVLIAQLFRVEEDKEEKMLPIEWQNIVEEYHDVFKEPKGLPPKRTTDHKITLLPDAKPINLRPYRFSYFQKLEIEKIVEELLKNSLIQESSSPYASPVLLVKKKDGGWRMCVDFRRLNSQTVKNKFPIPIIEDILDELHGAVYFSKLDLRSGYHQIRMNEEDVSKTAFRTHHGHYEFLVMPFGLTNAPATFQALMNQIFKPYLRKFILVFFDDILVYSKSLKEHQEHLKIALKILRKNAMYAKRSKCEIGATKLEYLGHVISANGVATDPKKIEAMVNWPTPKSVRELRGFLGLTGYYRRFVKHYSSIAKPLTNQLKKNSFGWNEEAEKAFNQLKKAMVTAPVLTMPDFSQPFILETDASDKGIGAVIMQGRRPIAFLSKCLGVKNQGMSTYEKEFLALLTAVQRWRHYLIGGPFVIKTDQISLKHLLEQKVNHMMQHKGLCKLMGMDYKIEYKKGCENRVADALSRQQGRVENQDKEVVELNAVTELIPQWVEEVKSSYDNDPWLEEIKEKEIREGANCKFTQHLGIWRYKGRLCIGNNQNWRNHIIQEVHDSSIGGHSGILATYKRIKGSFYWPHMKEDVYQYVISCDNCQQNKNEHIKLPGLLQPLPIPEEAWRSVSMDFITGLPKSEGKEVIMVVVDRLTKYAHFMALKHPFQASNVAQVFLDTVYRLHGLPTSIVSDRDPVFTSKFWQALMSNLGVKLNMSTAHHPQTDGQTERVNQCIEGYLRCMMFNQVKNWVRWLPLAELWYNTNYHTSLKTTPFQALYGYAPPQLPLGSPPKSTIEAVNEMMKERHQWIVELKEQLKKSQDRMKKWADEKRTERKFSVGDWVYLKLQPYRQISVQKRSNFKLSPKFYGPFEIIDKVGEVAYHLRFPDEDATWEDYYEIEKRFPELILRDKDYLEKGRVSDAEASRLEAVENVDWVKEARAAEGSNKLYSFHDLSLSTAGISKGRMDLNNISTIGPKMGLSNN
ncbi:polyprotein [Rhynchospora pubera]|uniref:Polyprotein n=1 Tax=Rhynchospora pubera TaxID=906938 RepID=A0AAV8GCV8_9POAL|nr:polyprotein [Rhynchospora pubera]